MPNASLKMLGLDEVGWVQIMSDTVSDTVIETYYNQVLTCRFFSYSHDKGN